MDSEEYLLQFMQIYENGVPPQPAIGHIPAAYILAAYAQCPDDQHLRVAANRIIRLEGEFEVAMHPVARRDVQRICSDHRVDPLVAYCFAMAWGGQWTGSSYDDFSKSIADPNALREKLGMLRNPDILPGPAEWPPRMKAFQLFSGNERVPGLGISYFTKILFFFLPEVNRGYVLDSRTALSISKFSGFLNPDFLPPNPASPPSWTTPAHYHFYCLLLERFSAEFGGNWTAADVELALFGAESEDHPGNQWREFIKD